jgi:hypothetical protein
VACPCKPAGVHLSTQPPSFFSTYLRQAHHRQPQSHQAGHRLHFPQQEQYNRAPARTTLPRSENRHTSRQPPHLSCHPPTSQPSSCHHSAPVDPRALRNADTAAERAAIVLSAGTRQNKIKTTAAEQHSDVVRCNMRRKRLHQLATHAAPHGRAHHAHDHPAHPINCKHQNTAARATTNVGSTTPQHHATAPKPASRSRATCTRCTTTATAPTTPNP